MITLKQCFIVLFIFVLPVISYSQENPKGFIITYENDTIYGEFSHNLRKNTLFKCYFKPDTEKEFRTYSPIEIKKFIAEGVKAYKSVITDYNNSRILAFYELIYEGEYDLYYNKDINGEYIFIGDKNLKAIWLKNTKRDVYVDNIKYKKEYKEYIGIFKYIFRDKPELYPQIEKLSLTQKSLIHFLQNLNSTKKPSYIKTFEKAKLQIGLSAGFQNISINKGYDFGEDLYYLDNSRFDAINNFIPGITFELNIPTISKTTDLGYEFSISKLNFKTTNHKTFYAYSLDYENYIELNRTSLNNMVYLKWNLSSRNMKPAILLGGFANLSIQDDYNRKLMVRWSNNNTYLERESTHNPFNMGDYGVCIGSSLEKKLSNNMALSGNIRYKKGMGLRHGLGTNYWSFTLDFFFANIKF